MFYTSIVSKLGGISESPAEVVNMQASGLGGTEDGTKALATIDLCKSLDIT